MKKLARHLEEQFIRVNHAGEYGAKRIYEGQRAFLKEAEYQEILAHMAEQEENHLKLFEGLLQERRIRPTLLSPLWHGAGYMVGALSGALGVKAAMACTVAVEEVIEEHYQKQLEQIKEKDPELKEIIEKCQAEEAEHKEIGLQHEAALMPGYKIFKGAIQAGSKLAIWLSTRI